MKFRIVWTDTELDEAMLTRGRWWWRRQAVVYRTQHGTWRFRNSDFVCADQIQLMLEQERCQVIAYGHCDLDWSRPRSKRETAKYKRQSQRLRLLP